MRASLRDYVAAYNTLTSLKKTEESMAQSGGSLDSTVVTTSENSAEVFAAFELQSKEFQNVQLDFENYMERLKEDIDLKAQKFEHIDYYDALLRDGNSKEIAVATDEVHSFDVRRKPLITVNPLFAKTSELPPTPSVEDITFEHMSINLPSIARIALNELNEDLGIEQFDLDPNNGFENLNSNESNTVELDSDLEFNDNILENPIIDKEEIDDSEDNSLIENLSDEEDINENEFSEEDLHEKSDDDDEDINNEENDDDNTKN